MEAGAGTALWQEPPPLSASHLAALDSPALRRIRTPPAADSAAGAAAAAAKSTSRVEPSDADEEISEDESEEGDEVWGASEIVPGVWVGRKEDAELPASLAEHRIGLVVSVHDEEQRRPVALDAMSPSETPQNVAWIRIEAADRADTDLLQHFDRFSDRLREFFEADESSGGALAGLRGVLVHCLAGQSRSVALVAAFLIREQNHSLRELIDWDGEAQSHGDGLMQRAVRRPNTQASPQLDV